MILLCRVWITRTRTLRRCEYKEFFSSFFFSVGGEEVAALFAFPIVVFRSELIM